MIRFILFALAVLLQTTTVSADSVDSFEQARKLAVDQNKPILMEFVHED